MKQTVLAFITPVKPGCEARLEELLAEISANLRDNKYVPFGNLRSLHFASLVILQDRKKGTRLVFENNFDGPLDRYLDDLLQHAMFGLHELYRCCEGYPNTSAGGGDGLWAYLREHVVWPNAARVGNVGRDVERIRQECDLRRALDDELDQVVRAKRAPASPAAVRRWLQEHVQQRTRELGWVAKAPPPRQTPLEQALAWSKVGATLLGALVFLPVLLPTAVVWARMLRRREARDEIWTGVPSPEHLQKLEANEDPPGYVQNHVASLAYVKPGRFRRATLRLVLWLVNMSSSVSTGGKLGGVSTIHFAHWSLLDDGESLLFLSNFDGSWESYLDDFIDLASTGLTAIWSNTEGFPRTDWRLFEGFGQTIREKLRGGEREGSQFLTGGAENGPRFKAIARERMVVTNVWYSAYPELTVQQIDENSAIREKLFARLDEQAERDWLRQF